MVTVALLKGFLTYCICLWNNNLYLNIALYDIFLFEFLEDLSSQEKKERELLNCITFAGLELDIG